VKRPRGRVRLVFDDLERSGRRTGEPRPVTGEDMSQRVFRTLKLTDKQLADGRQMGACKGSQDRPQDRPQAG